MLMPVESVRLSHGAWEMLGGFIHFCIILSWTIL